MAVAFLLGFAVSPPALNLSALPTLNTGSRTVTPTGQTTTVQVKATSNYRFTPAEVGCPPVTAWSSRSPTRIKA